MNIEVKRAFVLADWMKAAHRCEGEEEFRMLLAQEDNRVLTLLEPELDQIIGGYPPRLERFEQYKWTVEDIVIADCFVWNQMGSRPWAVGSVREVGEKFLRMEPTGSRIWKMKLFAGIFSSQLPMIIVRQNGRSEIDDGSHRAIAMHLFGIQRAKAFVGVLNKRTNDHD